AEYLGLPSPGETALILGSVLAATTHRLAIPVVIADAAVAAFVGANAGFAIGYFGGSRVLLRITRWLHIKDERLKVARYLFNHFGAWVILFGRFVTILRAYISFLGGVTRMSYLRFEVANAVGAVAWATFWGVVYYFGGALVARFNGIARFVAIGLAIAGLVAGVVLIRANEGRLTERAEREMPGPLEWGTRRNHPEDGSA
ncbi:MAG: DedA family protein, partial [Candidatus Dormibacteraceae bacterium]